MSLGPAEIMVVLVIALLVFGPTRLPELGRQVGRAMKEFRKFQSTLKVDMDSVFTEDGSKHQEPAPTLPPKAVEPPIADASEAPPVDGADPPPA